MNKAGLPREVAPVTLDARFAAVRRHLEVSVTLRRLVLVTLLLLSLALVAQAQEWKTYSYATEGFRISMPSEPQFQTSPVEGGYTLHAYATEIPNGALLVGVVDYGTTNVSDDPYARLEKGMDASLDYWKAQKLRETKITIDGHPGIEFEGESDSVHWFGRYYLVHSVLYEVLAGYPAGSTYSGLHQFTDSFRLMPRQNAE